MKIIIPLEITSVAPATLTSTSVTSPETGTTTYASGTTYALNDRVSFPSDTSTVTITVATPAVITWTAHELVAGSKVAFTTTGLLPYLMTASKLYYVEEVLTVDTFTITEIESGPAINTGNLTTQSGTHTGTCYTYKKYKSLQASNIGKLPRKASSATWWEDLGATNARLMFDGTITSQTTSTDIDATITVTKAVDTIALLNISGYYCTVTCTDTTLGIVYNVTHTVSTLINGDYEDIPELVITDIPTFNSGTIRIYLMRSASQPVKQCGIGACVIGLAIDAGDTEYGGASVSIQDYSVIEQNAFGDYDITPRTYSKNASFQVMVLNTNLAYIYQTLTKRRSKKTLYIGSSSYASTAIYGFPDDWKILIQYPEYSVLNIDIKSLT